MPLSLFSPYPEGIYFAEVIWLWCKTSLRCFINSLSSFYCYSGTMQCLYFCNMLCSHCLSCSNRKQIFPVVEEMIRWETLSILPERMENVLKGLAFKSQCFIFLWHVAWIFRHPQRRGVYLEPLHADSFSLNAAEQRHHQFFLPTPWLHYKGAASQTSNASRADASLSSRQPLFFFAPSKVNCNNITFYAIQLAPTFWAVCYLGVWKSRLWSYLLVRDRRN